jgi:CBS-domain-containing membrane protein
MRLPPAERREFLDALAQHPGCEIMSSPAIVVQESSTLLEAIALLRQHELKRLPVVDHTCVLVGKITRSDLLREAAFAASSLNGAEESSVGGFNPGLPVLDTGDRILGTIDRGRLFYALFS